MDVLQKFIFIGAAGAFGTASRYLLSAGIQRIAPGGFPFGTAAVNILGCLLFGLIWGFAESRLQIGSQLRMVIFVGFLGAFTSFSTYIFECAGLLGESQFFWAFGNMMLQNVVGLLAMFLGLKIGVLV